MLSQRIGIFGGTFDPIHIGHLVAAMNAQQQLTLDTVLMVVAHVPWQKAGSREITPSATRLAMVQAAVDELDGIDASSIEIDRGGDSYSIDTVAAIRKDAGSAEIFLIIGGDVAPQLDTWHRHEELRHQVTVAVIERPGSIGARVPKGWSAVRVNAPLVDLSATELRLALDDGRPVKYLIPDPALKIYRDHKTDQRSTHALDRS